MKSDQSHGDDIPALFAKGKDFYGRSDFEKALEIFHHILDQHVDKYDSAVLFESLGMCYHAREEYSKAIEYFEKALLIYKKDSSDKLRILVSLRSLGDAYREKGDYDRSLEYFEEANSYLHLYTESKQFSDLFFYHLGKGWSHFLRAEYAEALKELKLGEQTLPLLNRKDILVECRNLLNYDFARFYFGTNKWNEASEYLEEIDDSLLWEAHRLTYRKMSIVLKAWDDMNLEAVSDFEQSGESLMDDYFGPLMGYYIGRAYYTLSQHNKARALLEKGLTYKDAPRWVVDKINECLGDLNKIN